MIYRFSYLLFVILAAVSCAQTNTNVASNGKVSGARHMVSAANPLAAQAGLDILRDGGGAVDAAIATQLVLGLVEPQSSGVGGGAFMLHFDAASGNVRSYDGRETAPRTARPDMFMRDGKPMKFMAAAAGGTSVGVPGLMRMLELAHRKHGKLPWARLFEPAIELAENGFDISPRLAGLLAAERILRRVQDARGYFYKSDGGEKPIGTRIYNKAMAATLRKLAKEGADAMYTGTIARAIVETVRKADNNPGGMSLSDLAAYRAVERQPVCAPYRRWRVCGMGPPSSGGLTVLQALGILETFDLSALPPRSPEAVHLVGEASALAFADRNAYVADSDFVPVPARDMLARNYLKRRAALISHKRASGNRIAGKPNATSAHQFFPSNDDKGLSTTHLSIIDSAGNAVSMTSSIETVFGSRLMTNGFILNNQLTDFSFRPSRNGRPVANSAAPGKRPRSSMSPTLVLDQNGKLVMATGSPGGSRIIGYVIKNLVAALDWNMSMQTAIDMPNFLNRNRGIELERTTDVANLKASLERKGHTVKVIGRASGLHGIRVVPGGLQGGADTRREGVILAD